jgi:hypothetical protein
MSSEEGGVRRVAIGDFDALAAFFGRLADLRAVFVAVFFAVFFAFLLTLFT